MKAEHVELRFGIIAREMGFITAEQLVEALKIQVMEEAENKKHRQIGTILLEKGLTLIIKPIKTFSNTAVCPSLTPLSEP